MTILVRIRLHIGIGPGPGRAQSGAVWHTAVRQDRFARSMAHLLWQSDVAPLHSAADAERRAMVGRTTLHEGALLADWYGSDANAVLRQGLRFCLFKAPSHLLETTGLIQERLFHLLNHLHLRRVATASASVDLRAPP